MSSFAFLSWAQIPGQEDASHICDMLILEQGPDTILVAGTQYDGYLTTWAIDDGLSLIDQRDFDNDATLGSDGAFAMVTTHQGLAVLSGGGDGSALQTHLIRQDDTLAGGRNVAQTAQTGFGQMEIFDTFTDQAGTQFVFGGAQFGGGLGCLILDATGAVIGSNMTVVTGNVADAVTHVIDGEQYLFSVTDGTQTAATLWSVGPQGQLSELSTMTPETGLWISDPTSVALATVNGITYAIVGSAGSGSLTVLQIDDQNTLQVTDHLLDDLDTRFAGVTTLQVVQHHGQTYVLAGGSDDGISLFVLMPDGQLVARGHIEDTTEMGLDNVSAISARSNGTTIDIFVASSSENGVTHLQFDSGPQGQFTQASDSGDTLTGTAGSDIIQGGAGDDTLYGGGGHDIITDGAGSDVLTGGSGQDVFTFGYDEQADQILDFQVGIDRIDLSNWPGLRSINQLRFETIANGIIITYGADTLTIYSANGEPIDAAQLSAADLLGGLRIPTEIEPGFPDPDPETPDLPDRPRPQRNIVVPTEDMFQNRSIITVDTIAGDGGDDTLTGGNGNDLIGGFENNDTLFGGGGNDILVGNEGADRILGEDGDDVLFGGAGSDRMAGGAGDDQLFGGAYGDRISGGTGDDELSGGTGDDWMNGGHGADLIYGGAGTDTIIGNRGRDTIYGEGGRDLIGGGGSNDLIYTGHGDDFADGSTGHDTIYGGSGEDLLRGHTGNDSIWGGDDNDRLFGNIGRDQLFGGDGWDYINGGPDHDQIYGGGGNDILLGYTGNDFIDGGGHRDRIHGGDGHDHILGGGGKDTIRGGNGNDTIHGQTGSDWIDGGRGDDILTGGRGRDVFVYSDGNDIITDFDARYDTLVLDANLTNFGANAEAIIRFHTEVENATIILDFGDGHRLELDGFTSLETLAAAIEFI